MSGVAKRTVFYETDGDGRIIPWDFALVTTGLGTMVEPKAEWFPRTCKGADNLLFTATDDVSRIDRMSSLSLDRNQYLYGENLHGGSIFPRTGR